MAKVESTTNPPAGITWFPTAEPSGGMRLQAAMVMGARNRAAALKAEIATAKRAWEQQHAELLDSYEAAKAAVGTAEGQLREMALAQYNLSGTKQPGPGVTVKVFRKARYDKGAALEWAIGRRLFLTLDVEPFEKFARDQPAQLDGIVDIVEEPRADIAQDLSAALGTKEEPHV